MKGKGRIQCERSNLHGSDIKWIDRTLFKRAIAVICDIAQTVCSFVALPFSSVSIQVTQNPVPF